MNERVKTILNFWFIECTMEDWFKKDKNFDKKIKKYFESDYIKAIKNELEDWQDCPEGSLALVILLDQFSRNLFRNNSKAFKYDYKTRLIVNEAIDRGDLEKINIDQSLFLILPLIHSEDISDHIFAHKLRKSYLLKHPKNKEIKKSWDQHSDIIKKFSRYPHRNKALKRTNTKDEDLFLSQSTYDW